MLTGENGILTQANNAREETRGGAVEEAKNIWEANKKLDEEMENKTAESLEELINRLVNEKLLTEDEKDKIIGNEEKGIDATGEITIGKRTIVFGLGAKTLVEAFKDDEIKIGDRIDYNPIASEDTGIEEKYRYESLPENNGYTYLDKQIFTVNNNNEEVNWIILGLSDDEKNLLITTEKPIRKEKTDESGDSQEKNDPYLYLSGIKGYINATNELNNICRIYRIW